MGKVSQNLSSAAVVIGALRVNYVFLITMLFLFFRVYINSAKCSGCFQLISANQYVMRALDHVYHINCFICVACGHPLQKGDQFVVKHGQLFCRLDYEKEMNMMAFSPKSKNVLYVKSNFQKASLIQSIAHCFIKK